MVHLPKGLTKGRCNMSDIGVWDQTYPVSEAERGKFIPLDINQITTLGYPATGRGKFALLTYNVNNVSGGGGISSNVAITNIPLPVTTTTVISTLEITPNTLIVAGGANNLFGTTPTTITFSPAVNYVEVYNNSNNTAFLLLSSSATTNSLTAQGMPLFKNSFYSISRIITAVTLNALASGSDIRIFGHYKV
jgi:hypothetical protein